LVSRSRRCAQRREVLVCGHCGGATGRLHPGKSPWTGTSTRCVRRMGGATVARVSGVRSLHASGWRLAYDL